MLSFLNTELRASETSLRISQSKHIFWDPQLSEIESPHTPISQLCQTALGALIQMGGPFWRHGVLPFLTCPPKHTVMGEGQGSNYSFHDKAIWIVVQLSDCENKPFANLYGVSMFPGVLCLIIACTYTPYTSFHQYNNSKLLLIILPMTHSIMVTG